MPKSMGLGRSHRGSTLVIFAFSIVALTAMVGLAIDLGAFYTVRSEAQRAADAAALAGATVFVRTGCVGGTSGVSCTGATVETAAATQAAAIGNSNLVGGANPAIAGTVNSDPSKNTCPFAAGTDVCFTVDGAGTNPRVSVLVQRTAAHSNAMPTFFAQIFGISTVDISATATAEAFSPTGGNATSASICLSCVKPFIAVDCDTNRTVPKTDANANQVCTVSGSPNSRNPYFFNPTTKAIVNPGVAPSGVIGEVITLHQNNAPSDWGDINLGQGNGQGLRTAITTCYPGNWGCGDKVKLVPGNRSNGQVVPYVQSLIHEGVSCNTNSGQDTIAISAGATPPFTITGGSANPYGLRGKVITTSDSIVTVPVYDGTTTGNGSNTTFTIIGFFQLFLTDGCGTDISAAIMNVITCQTLTNGCNGQGSSGNPGGGFVSGGGASAIPVRLVQ